MAQDGLYPSLPISEFCIHRLRFESVLNVPQRIKASVLLHFVAVQRSKKNLIEAAGERRLGDRVIECQ